METGSFAWQKARSGPADGTNCLGLHKGVRTHLFCLRWRRAQQSNSQKKLDEETRRSLNQGETSSLLYADDTLLAGQDEYHLQR
eukprot:8909695-Pyramimonas_sp.AAC.1